MPKLSRKDLRSVVVIYAVLTCSYYGVLGGTCTRSKIGANIYVFVCRILGLSRMRANVRAR